MGDHMSNPGVQIREARVSDAITLGRLCRRSFVKSPEWRVPMFIVGRWWRGVIEHPGCCVRVVSDDSGIIGFYIGVEDPGVWETMSKQGPHCKWMKGLVLLTRPAFLRSYHKKRRQARIGRGSGDGNTQNKGVNHGFSAQRVRVADVVDDRGGLYLAIMALDPRVRGRGIGKRVVEHFGDLGVELGVGTLWLHVDPRNERAQGLYLGFGYQFGGRDGNSFLMYKPVESG